MAGSTTRRYTTLLVGLQLLLATIVIAGSLIEKFRMERYLEDFVRDVIPCECEAEIPEMTRKTMAAAAERDPVKRAGIYRDLQREHQAVSPFVIIFQEIETAACRADADRPGFEVEVDSELGSQVIGSAGLRAGRGPPDRRAGPRRSGARPRPARGQPVRAAAHRG